ncbi:MAG: oligopeptide transporter, OPT family [Verrucomicrobia bacterium]|nr:oligopeptide transporter, OPT family [Verrucomicrobiota bacterium]
MSASSTAPEPFIPDQTSLPEFTARALLTGTFLGMIFGASSLYLVLKVGLTVSASIPVAVISIAWFRMLARFGFRDSTILENNIIQTAGSAGESIAFGLGVTMPAILILGFDLELSRVALVAVLGGLLGILMMVPLRRALIVREHGTLRFPEGTACAHVLKAGASAESRASASASARAEWERSAKAGAGNNLAAATIFTGFGIGLLYKTAMVAFKGWRDVPEKVFSKVLPSGSVGCEISPELLGVGYIIGPRIAAVTVAGGILSHLVLIPMIKFFGSLGSSALEPGSSPISQMSPGDIRGAYVLYIGAGAVAAGGLISLFRSIPTIWHGIQGGLQDLGWKSTGTPRITRTNQDISMKVVVGGLVVLLAAIWMAPPLQVNLVGALLIVIFGFIFVTVSSRLTGEIGSSSNPISGMTVATLLFTCLIFFLLDWRESRYYLTALSIGGIVCIASSNGGTTAQDLKTGFLVGGTPRLQQAAILVGALASALVLGPILLTLNETATVYVPIAQIKPGLTTDASKLTRTEKKRDPDKSEVGEPLKVWHNTDAAIAPAGKYLVAPDGKALWLVDPGINGSHSKREDGTEVRKFDAPKALLMSYIIKGILDQKLPWALVLLGVLIAVVLELCGVPSLAFAVGVYLPISSSMPLFMGGVIRAWIDRRQRRELEQHKTTEEELAAESDKSSGVMLASGYIAGGAIAGIVIAFSEGIFTDFSARVTRWSSSHNPFFSAENWNEGRADALSLLPFLALILCLLWVGQRGVSRRPTRI